MYRCAYCARIYNFAVAGGGDLDRLQKRQNLRAATGISEAHQREGSVPPDHERRIAQHLQQSTVEVGDCIVLSHDPGIGIAYFFHRVGR